MSANMVAAFNFIIKLQGRDVTLDIDNTIYSIKLAPSNYFRKLAMIEEVVEEGYEFVISKTNLDSVSAPEPKRGDVIIDSVTGDNSIVEVKPLFALGELLGYRVRTG